jgi:hypothetical protein
LNAGAISQTKSERAHLTYRKEFVMSVTLGASKPPIKPVATEKPNKKKWNKADKKEPFFKPSETSAAKEENLEEKE